MAVGVPIPVLFAIKSHWARGCNCAAATGCLVSVHTFLPAAVVAVAQIQSVRGRLGVTKTQADLQEEVRAVNYKSSEVTSPPLKGDGRVTFKWSL